MELEKDISTNNINKHDGLHLKHHEREHQIQEFMDEPHETEYMIYPEEEEVKVDTSGNLIEDQIPNQFRNIIWSLIKQLGKSVDLSRVTLPTFILEPRSMLEKMTDFLTHIELVDEISTSDDPLKRIIQVLKWYVSGMYIRPKGVKKGYNPILGEIFRCMWYHPDDGSRTLLVAEQVSHHPPVSAFYAINRKKGYIFNGSILFKSTFTGASVGSILEGAISCYFLKHQEEYILTLPAAYATGFLSGSLIMEIGGHISIKCEQTGYRVELEFKRKPWIGGEYNVLHGHIYHNGQVIRTLRGKWDKKVELSVAEDSNIFETLWEPSGELFSKRIRKQKPKEMKEYESDYLWQKVSQAIRANDHDTATVEKTKIEDAQRAAARLRKEQSIEYQPKLFEMVGENPRIWHYKYMNRDPYDPENELGEYENDGVIHTLYKHPPKK